MKDGVLAVITAHNEMQYVKLNVQILRGELQGADSEIVVVDNCSDDGLQQWLMTQKNISYIVCDDKLEGYGEILKVVAEQFGNGRDLLLLRANCFLTPGSIACMKAALRGGGDIAVAGPVGNNLCGEQRCFLGNSYEEAQDFQKSIADEVVETAYLNADVMLLRGDTLDRLETGLAIPQAVLRGYMKNVLRDGKCFAIAKKAVCFAVGDTKDEPYRPLAANDYLQERLHKLLYHFGDIDYKGVYLYKYLKSDILAGINHQNRLQNTKRSKLALTWGAKDVALSTEKEAMEMQEVIENLPQKEVLFVTLPIRRMHQGEYIHTAMETYMASLSEELYLDLEIVGDVEEDRKRKIPTPNRYAVLEAAIPRAYGVGDVNGKELLEFLWCNFIHPLEQTLGMKFEENIFHGCYRKAVYLLKARVGYMGFYKEVISRVKPKVIIYSHGPDMVLACLRDAALELEIPTLEISHGIVTAGAYHKHLVYADDLAAYSEIIAKKSRESGNGRVLGIGKPGVYEQAVQAERGPVIVIAFISSLEHEIFSYARNLAMRLDKQKYQVIYKSHNSELWSREEIAEIQTEIVNFRFVPGSVDIRELIGASDIVVGIRSSGIFDALPYPEVKVIAVKDTAEDFSEEKPKAILQEVIERGEIVLAEDEEQLYREISSYERGKTYRGERNCFWQENAKERFQALVDSYLQK